MEEDKEDKLPNLQRALLPILEYMAAHERIREDRELLAAVERLLAWTQTGK